MAQHKANFDRYTAIFLPIVDATVAAALCISGPVKYCIIDNVAVTDDWLVGDFVPKITSKFGNRVAAILGRPLLFALNDVECRKMIPDNLYCRLRVQYDAIKKDDKNPIEKKKIEVYSTGGQLKIELAASDDDDDDNNDTTTRTTRKEATNRGTKVVLAQNQALRNQIADLSCMSRQQHEYVKTELTRMKSSIR